MTVKKLLLSSEEYKVSGQATLTASQAWTVPEGVFSISVLAVNPGVKGLEGTPSDSSGQSKPGGAGGDGGSARYVNSIAVTPGQQLVISVTGTAAGIPGLVTGVSGGESLGTAGAGQRGGSGGIGVENPGGAGKGGDGFALSSPNLRIQSGTSAGAFPGGGGGGGGGGPGLAPPGVSTPSGVGGAGCVRILWPGNQRMFPSTRTADEVPGEIAWKMIPSPEAAPVSAPGLATDRNGIWVLLHTSDLGTIYYRSDDNGKTFAPRSFGSIPAARASSVLYAGGVFFVSNTNNQILRSVDKGLTWSAVAMPARINCFASSDDVLIACANGAVYRSTNAGLTFTPATIVSVDPVATPITSASYGDGVFLIGLSGGNPQRSADGAQIFTQSVRGERVGGLKPYFDGSAFRGVRAGAGVSSDPYVQTSLDKGINFSSELVGAQLSGGNRSLVRAAGRLIVAGVVGKFYEKKDGSATWSIPTTLTNNLGAAVELGPMETDGFGVTIVTGVSGFLMRGELK